jgi:hypothetical protein
MHIVAAITTMSPIIAIDRLRFIDWLLYKTFPDKKSHTFSTGRRSEDHSGSRVAISSLMNCVDRWNSGSINMTCVVIWLSRSADK